MYKLKRSEISSFIFLVSRQRHASSVTTARQAGVEYNEIQGSGFMAWGMEHSVKGLFNSECGKKHSKTQGFTISDWGFWIESHNNFGIPNLGI